MKKYVKPEIEMKDYKSTERFAVDYEDIFGTGHAVPVTTYTMGDDSSGA